MLTLAASLEDYRYTSPHYGKDTADHARYTELRMQAHEYAGKQFIHSCNLPGNKALSGIKSKMYKGQGANELVLDDSTNEQRIRAATDHGKTELNQGYLVHPRGEGFELRADLAGALRAAQGILISSPMPVCLH